MIAAGMLHAERKYRNNLRLPWSEVIDETMTKLTGLLHSLHPPFESL